MPPPAPHPTYAVAAHVVWRDVEGELVLFDEPSGRYHSLNLIGSLIWRRLAAGATAASVIDELAARYDASRAVIAEQVEAFIAETVELQLICAAAEGQRA